MSEESSPNRPFVREKRTWYRKFRDAFRGVVQSVRVQSSYRVHFSFALLVPIVAFVLHLNLFEWCFIIFLISAVIAAEMFNTSVEALSRVVTEDYDERIRHSLDIASGAVLMVSGGAAIIGFLIFLTAFRRLLGG
jgi:Diacylglycerol kinase